MGLWRKAFLGFSGLASKERRWLAQRFRYPFAAIRWLTKDDLDFQPSGRNFPSVVLGLDWVDASADKSRLALDPNEDAYARFRAEIAFKAPVLKWEHDRLYISAAYRHFQEL